MKKFFVILLAVLCCTFLAAQSLELPKLQNGKKEFVLQSYGYTIAYNFNYLQANWSAWTLTKDKLNQVCERSEVFYEDERLSDKYKVRTTDYKYSGYDRGHLCPAADMRYAVEAMHDCFYMSNMCPQTAKLNRIYWADLESQCRRWAVQYDTLYICAGPIFSVKNQYIGKQRKIAVPTAFFKVLLAVHQGNYIAIGFIFQNNDSQQDFEYKCKSVDEVEKVTGYDFFYMLPDSVEDVVEKNCSLNGWR